MARRWKPYLAGWSIVATLAVNPLFARVPVAADEAVTFDAVSCPFFLADAPAHRATVRRLQTLLRDSQQPTR
jgi:hypothetical protein